MIFLANVFNRIGWNDRLLTETDFDRVCRRERIKVVEYPMESSPGFYMACGGRHFITVDSRLSGVRRMYVLWHELAHYFLHVPPHANGVRWFRLFPNTREEHEAEAFVAVAFMPLSMVLSKLPWEIQEEYGYPTKLIELRKWIYDNYKI